MCIRDRVKAILEGYVSEQNTQGQVVGPLSGATVQLSGGPSITTDTQGKYRFINLNPASYSVTVSKTGYHSTSRTVSLSAGQTKTENFYLRRQSGPPSAYDYNSQRGRHLIEGMPGSLTFESMVAWSGSPGTVRFLVAGTWRTASITNLSGGLARATLTVSAPGSIGPTSEWAIEVINGEGYRNTFSTGVYFYRVPQRVRDWYQRTILWNPRLGATTDVFLPLWNLSIPSGVYSTQGSIGYSQTLQYDPDGGTFSASRVGDGCFNSRLHFSGVEILGEGRLDSSGRLAYGFRGYQSPSVSGSMNLTVTGEAGLGAPVVYVVGVVFPPAAPAIQDLLKVPVVKDVVGAMKVRVYVTGGLGLAGNWTPTGGSCWFGATSYNLSGTVGLKAQAVLALGGAEAGVYAGATGTPSIQFCPQWQYQGVTVRGYVGVYAEVWFFSYSREYGYQMTFSGTGGQMAVLFYEQSEEGELWCPIGEAPLRWGEMNRLVSDQLVTPHVLRDLEETATVEETILENVTKLANPSVVADGSGVLVAGSGNRRS